MINLIIIIFCLIYIIGFIVIWWLSDKKEQDKEKQQKEFKRNLTDQERNLINEYEQIKGHFKTKTKDKQ